MARRGESPGGGNWRSHQLGVAGRLSERGREGTGGASAPHAVDLEGVSQALGTAPLALLHMPSPSNSKVIGPEMAIWVSGFAELFLTPASSVLWLPGGPRRMNTYEAIMTSAGTPYRLTG